MIAGASPASSASAGAAQTKAQEGEAVELGHGILIENDLQ
jgi:hypothetical protein